MRLFYIFFLILYAMNLYPFSDKGDNDCVDLLGLLKKTQIRKTKNLACESWSFRFVCNQESSRFVPQRHSSI